MRTATNLNLNYTYILYHAAAKAFRPFDCVVATSDEAYRRPIIPARALAIADTLKIMVDSQSDLILKLCRNKDGVQRQRQQPPMKVAAEPRRSSGRETDHNVRYVI